jgi:tRNA (cmo5U34)-methyltransferase
MGEPESKIPKYIGPDTSSRHEMMSREEIRGRFDKEVASLYSQRDPVWLPDFKYMFSLVPGLIRPYLQGNSVVLDVGAGTGKLSRSVLEAFPDERKVLVDFSSNMLSAAPEVLSRFEGRFETVIADFIDMDFGNGKYSAVVSSFAIHHCRSNEEYGELYRRIGKAIGPTGIFVCCDVVAGADKNMTLQNETEWAVFLRQQGLSENEVDRILSNYHVEDSPIDLWTHLRLLSSAGFKAVEVVWKRSNFAIYAGVK